MPTTLTVFYSWQSDLPKNRNFIDTALEQAISQINKVDADRQLVLDQGTRDTPGAPHIADTILRKIERAAVFVADVTSVTPAPSCIPNPNVMLETGYALAKLGPGRVITIVNEANGSVEQLPFDLSYRRALTFTWYQEPEDRPEVRKALVRTLVTAIREVLPPAVAQVGPSEAELPEPVYRGEETRWNFPRVQLASAEQCWVEVLAEAFETGKRPADHVLFREHRARLGPEFRPDTVDARLVQEQGRDITPLGLWHVNPETPWLRRLDMVFRYVKKLLAQDHGLEVLSVVTLSKKLGLAHRDVSHAIHLLRTCHGWCCAGTSQNTDPQHYLPLISAVTLGKDPVLQFYERFASIDEVVQGTLLAPHPPREF